MRRGQIKQVFIYLGSLFIIGVLITIGFQSSSSFLNTACDVNTDQFETTLFNVLDANRGPGNLQQTSINAPCDTTRLCIGDQKTENTSRAINASIDAGAGDNIFLMQNDEIRLALSYDDLASTPVTCSSASANTFDITVEGQSRGQVTVT